MTRNQNTLLMGAAIVIAFLLAGGAALCNPESYRDRAEQQKKWEELDAMSKDPEAYFEKKRLEEQGGGAEPATMARVAGAYYPEDHVQDEGGGIDPLVFAVVGGGLVFGLVGGVVFLALGRREPDEATEPTDDAADDGFEGLVQIPDDPPR